MWCPTSGSWISSMPVEAQRPVSLDILPKSLHAFLPQTHPKLTSPTQPQRALTFIKHNHPLTTYHSTILTFYRSMWNTATHHDLSKPDLLISALTNSNLFSAPEIDAIIAGANDKKYKDLLLAETEKVVKMGAFGAPFFWVRNGRGVEEPFFGSDRLVDLFVFGPLFLGFHRPDYGGFFT